MSWASLAVLIHVLLGFVLVTGLIGRWIILRRAAAADAVEAAFRLTQAASPFERMAITGSGLVLLAGLLAAWARGYPLLGLRTGWLVASLLVYLSIAPLIPLVFLPRARRFEAEMDAARAAGTVTPGLRAAFRDRVVAAAHAYELVAVGIVIALMVLKPF